MIVYILTRTDSFCKEHCVIEGVYTNKDEAKAVRQKMLKNYNAPSIHCKNIEISEYTLIGG